VLIVLEDDDCIRTYPSVEAFVQKVEGFDAEETLRGAYDEAGTPYHIEWLSPNASGRILGPLRWVDSGLYTLVPIGPPDISGLRRLLDSSSHALPSDATRLPSIGRLSNHRVDVCDPGLFLQRLLRELATGTRLSLEGELSTCNFDERIVVSRQPVEKLPRNTNSPLLDFVVLALEPSGVEQVLSEISRMGLRRRIVHVQVERDGILEVGAYDNFHSECVTTGPAIRPGMLTQLRDAGVIRGFSACSS